MNFTSRAWLCLMLVLCVVCFSVPLFWIGHDIVGLNGHGVAMMIIGWFWGKSFVKDWAQIKEIWAELRGKSSKEACTEECDCCEEVKSNDERS